MGNIIVLKYPAIFNIDSDGICISFPDIPECLSCAYTKKQARAMAKEALELALHRVEVEKVPARKYPIQHFSSKKFYIRTITVRMSIKENCLFSVNVVDF